MHLRKDTLIRKPQFLFVCWCLRCYIVSIVINCQSRLFMSCLVCFQLATTLIVHWIQYVRLSNHSLMYCNFVLIGLNHFDLTILYHYLVCVFVVDSFHNTNTYVMYKLTRFTIPSFTNSCVLACWIKKRDIAFFQVHLIHQLSDFPTHHILIFRLALFISICRYGISMLWFIN